MTLTKIDVALGKRFQVYRDRSKQWRWRVRATNGRIVADSAEGYRRRGDAIRGIGIVIKLAIEVTVAAMNAQKRARRTRGRR